MANLDIKINPALAALLIREAQREGKTPNALTKKILEQYIEDVEDIRDATDAIKHSKGSYSFEEMAAFYKQEYGVGLEV